MKMYTRITPSPFCNWSFLRSETATTHSRSRGNYKIKLPKGQLQAVCLPLWLGARRHWCRHRKYYICPAPPHQPLNSPPMLGCHTLALQDTLRPQLAHTFFVVMFARVQLRLDIFRQHFILLHVGVKKVTQLSNCSSSSRDKEPNSVA